MEETKQKFKRRLIEAGDWGKFCSLRSKMVDIGYPPDRSEYLSRALFPPPGYCDVELAHPDDQEDLEHARRILHELEPKVQLPAKSPMPKGFAKTPYPPVEKQKKKAVEAPKREPVDAEPANVPLEAPPPPLAKPVPAPDCESKPASKLSEFRPGEDGVGRAAIEWVAAALGESTVTQDDSPSLAAWNLYTWCTLTDENTAEFWLRIWPKVLPTKSQIDKESQMMDDGRGQAEMIDRVIKAKKAAEAKAKKHNK